MDRPGAEPGAARRKAAFVFIFATILLDMLAMGITIPVLPKLVEDFVGGDTQEAARIFGFFGTAWALMQFLFAPLQGTLSDSFGRRPVILISNFGVGLDYVLMALAPSLGWLFVGRILSGIASSSIATAYAYVTDVTPEDKRAARFGLLGAAFGAGFVLGPALGGLAGSISPRLPFWIAAALSLLNACYGFLILPESLPPAQRVRFDWRNANPFGALALLRTHVVLIWLGAVNFLGNLAHNVLPSVSVLYLMYRYGWDERLVGLALAFVGISSIVVQAMIVGPVTKTIGERASLMVGLAFGVLGFLVFALARTGIEFCAGIPLLAIWGLESPASMALMSRLVGPSEQGRLQGANASIMGLASLFGPALFTQTFAFAIGGGYRGVVAGAPFMVAAFLVGAATVLAWWVTRAHKNELQIARQDAM
jgi:MFS transporter, DHA1 family, tetracycline resistance protein